MSRIGVFVCHCGMNIERTVDTQAVASTLSEYPGIVFTADFNYLCADPGQQLIKDAIVEHKLEGIIVAACSPTMHEPTFRRVAEDAGLNPYLCEIANSREHCSWGHQDRDRARGRCGCLPADRRKRVITRPRLSSRGEYSRCRRRVLEHESSRRPVPPPARSRSVREP